MNSRLSAASTMSRRSLLGRSAAVAGGAAVSSFAAPAFLRQPAHAFRQDTDVSGPLTQWGFGIAETNPLARARVLAFEEAFPDVDLEIVETFDEQSLLTAAASDTLPDALWLSRFETAAWAARGVLQPLTEFIERDGYDMSVFYEAAVDEATYDGEIYGVPGGADVRALFVNVDHLEEIGVSVEEIDTSDWESLVELGVQLTEIDGSQVSRWGFGHKAEPGGGGIWLWGRANGGSFMNEDATEPTFNHELNVEALDWAVRAYEEQGGFQAYEGFATTFQGDQQFAEGQVSLAIYEQWMMSAAIATVAPDMNFALLPIREHGSGPDGPMHSFTGGNAWYIPANAQNPEAAWEYIKFLHTDDTWRIGAEAVRELRESEGNPYIPSLTGKTSADQLQIDELYSPLSEHFDEAVELLPELLAESHNREISGSPVAGQLNDIMEADGVGPAMRGNASAQEALDMANDEAQFAIDSFI